MAPKTNCNPLKLASIVNYMQKSRVAHNIKDLEKHLPSVASINGMQVKDYIQDLSDENKIHVEKIGSGNWYWSFASEDKKTRQKARDDAQAAHDKAGAINQDLKQKLADAQALRENGEEMPEGGSESREELITANAQLDAQLKILKQELAAYSDNDPTELERKLHEIAAFKKQADGLTDDIYCLEGWFRSQGQDEPSMKALRKGLYGDELDEDGMLKELV